MKRGVVMATNEFSLLGDTGSIPVPVRPPLAGKRMRESPSQRSIAGEHGVSGGWSCLLAARPMYFWEGVNE